MAYLIILLSAVLDGVIASGTGLLSAAAVLGPGDEIPRNAWMLSGIGGVVALAKGIKTYCAVPPTQGSK